MFLALFVVSRGPLRTQSVHAAEAAVEKIVDLGTVDAAPALLGRDGGYSALFQGRSVWVYGDTILSRSNRCAPALISNSCSWTTDLDAADGIAGFSACREFEGMPLEFFPFTDEESAYNRNHRADACRSEPCGARWALWPGAVIADSVHQRLLLFFKKVLVLPGFLNFKTAGHSLIVWQPPDNLPVRIGEYENSAQRDVMFGDDEPAFGSAALVVNSMLYVFGCNLEGYGKPCRLARVPLAAAHERRFWQFYSAAQGWQSDPGKCTVILEGNDMMSVSYNPYLDRYLAVYSAPMSNDVMLRTAAKIEGPWSEPLRAFAARMTQNDIGWVYDAMEHPEYAQAKGKIIYVSYTRQTGPLTFEMRLIAVTFR